MPFNSFLRYAEKVISEHPKLRDKLVEAGRPSSHRGTFTFSNPGMAQLAARVVRGELPYSAGKVVLGKADVVMKTLGSEKVITGVIMPGIHVFASGRELRVSWYPRHLTNFGAGRENPGQD